MYISFSFSKIVHIIFDLSRMSMSFSTFKGEQTISEFKGADNIIDF